MKACIAAARMDTPSGSPSVERGSLEGGKNPTNIAELADFVVGLALGVEVSTTLATAHHQASQGVFEDLLEAEELENGQVDRGVEAESTLVRAEGRVEL